MQHCSSIKCRQQFYYQEVNQHHFQWSINTYTSSITADGCNIWTKTESSVDLMSDSVVLPQSCYYTLENIQ